MSVMDVARIAGGQLRLVSPPRRRTATSEGFYEPPDPLGDGEPGDVIRSEPMDAYLAPGVRLRARAWRVLYRSTSAIGRPTAVSGTVLVPYGRIRAARPLIGYGVGTHGIGDSAAPSRLLARGLEWESGMIAMILARGWAVAITDYEGLGTPGDHTYMVGRALGPNVLDAMRAARQLHPSELPEQGPAAIVGYSEGGAAAAWAAQLQPGYAPDVPLTAVAAGAAAADVELGGSSRRRHVLLVLHRLRRDRLRRRLSRARARRISDAEAPPRGSRRCASRTILPGDVVRAAVRPRLGLDRPNVLELPGVARAAAREPPRRDRAAGAGAPASTPAATRSSRSSRA